MKCNKAKELLLNTCLRTSENGEVSWMNSFSGQGKLTEYDATLVFSTYLGEVDLCVSEVEKAIKVLNLPKER